MTARPYAVITSGVVTNVCLWDGASDWAPPDGSTAVDVSAVTPTPGPGWTYSGTTFTAPTVITPVPASVTRFQALAALSNAGLLTQATNAVNAAGGLTLLAWENALDFNRNSPTITTLGSALGLTSTQIDNLFVAASQISA